MLSPGWCPTSAERIPAGEVMLWPPSEVIVSPAVRPALAAAEPDSAPATAAPVLAGVPGALPDEPAIAMPRKAVDPM